MHNDDTNDDLKCTGTMARAGTSRRRTRRGGGVGGIPPWRWTPQAPRISYCDYSSYDLKFAWAGAAAPCAAPRRIERADGHCSDNLFEDVNGNGRADFAASCCKLNQMTWIAANEPTEPSTTTATAGSISPTSSGSSTTSERRLRSLFQAVAGPVLLGITGRPGFVDAPSRREPGAVRARGYTMKGNGSGSSWITTRT